MTSTGPAPTHTRTEAGERLLADLRAEIGRADTKASVLVAALGLTGGVSSGRLASSEWTPGRLGPPGTALWWAGALSLALALFCLLMAVLPRYSGTPWTPGRPLTYFGDIQHAARAGQLTDALADTARDPGPALLAALEHTSGIAARKHQWVRGGLIAFCAGTALIPASLLTG
ncbi:Pycsar system effector family protein [Streptomyces sp. NPDC048441]|uniref:Pycsar system effector family protein n=1 Tax=Streptomyces sp. NPDC048441 TaxID=3365552 RepID=UPI00371D8C50